MIEKRALEEMYLKNGMSVQVIADKLGYSRRGVKYWLEKHKVPMRTLSEAVYLWHNPDGDPFKFRRPRTMRESELYGMGIGLYWGEGTKSNKSTIRLGNTDPALIRTFIQFLATFFTIKKHDLRFGLQLFTDMSPEKALSFWCKELDAKPSQFYKPTITISGSVGTYRQKSQYGVLTVYYNNKKARQKLEEIMPM